MSKKILILSGNPRKGGYADCVNDAVEKGVIIGNGVYEPGKVKGSPAMKKAYKMGRNV